MTIRRMLLTNLPIRKQNFCNSLEAVSRHEEDVIRNSRLLIEVRQQYNLSCTPNAYIKYLFPINQLYTEVQVVLYNEKMLSNFYNHRYIVICMHLYINNGKVNLSAECFNNSLYYPCTQTLPFRTQFPFLRSTLFQEQCVIHHILTALLGACNIGSFYYSTAKMLICSCNFYT